MRPLLTSLGISTIANAFSLAAAAWLFDGFDIRFWWFVVAVVLFTALTVTLREVVVGTVVRFVRAYTIAGGLVLTFVALWVTDLAVPRRGFDIEGNWTWIGVTAIVWAAGVAYGEVDKKAPADAPPVGESLP
jgi:FtsH-binding integral membrane protein